MVIREGTQAIAEAVGADRKAEVRGAVHEAMKVIGT